LFVCLAGAGLTIASCGHPGGTGGTGTGGSNGTGGSGSCPVGTEGCPCDGTTCNQGLSCADLGGQTQCVTTATGTGGSTGTGGNVATGGSPGTGGSPANNLITNGDFSQGDTDWHFESGTANVNNGQYCETNLSGSSPLFGWQNMASPLTLTNGQSYTLSYRAMGSNSATLHIKVAHAVSPYTPDDYETSSDDKLTGSLQTFTHTFTPTAGNDDNTGVAFFVTAGQSICIASVSLTAD
jgi:hypothetical protein